MCISHRESKKCKNIARAKGLFWEDLKLLYFLKEFNYSFKKLLSRQTGKSREYGRKGMRGRHTRNVKKK